MTKSLWCTLLVFLTLVLSCAGKDIRPRIESHPLLSRLEAFFSLCESDARRACAVISEKDLIKNLTHLHRMNEGGKRYYLLERENITAMIKSVTDGIYSDFILINRHGVIIYTMSNDELFGKNVRSSLKESPLAGCFTAEDQDMHVEDLAAFPLPGKKYNLYVSIRVIREGTFHGVFLLQVESEKIAEHIEKGSALLSLDGICRLSRNDAVIGEMHRYYDKMDLNRLHGEKQHCFEAGATSYCSYMFRFKNLEWIAVSLR